MVSSSMRKSEIKSRTSAGIFRSGGWNSMFDNEGWRTNTLRTRYNCVGLDGSTARY